MFTAILTKILVVTIGSVLYSIVHYWHDYAFALGATLLLQLGLIQKYGFKRNQSVWVAVAGWVSWAYMGVSAFGTFSLGLFMTGYSAVVGIFPDRWLLHRIAFDWLGPPHPKGFEHSPDVDTRITLFRLAFLIAMVSGACIFFEGRKQLREWFYMTRLGQFLDASPLWHRIFDEPS